MCDVEATKVIIIFRRFWIDRLLHISQSYLVSEVRIGETLRRGTPYLISDFIF